MELEAWQDGNFKFEGQIIISLPDFVVSSGLCTSKKEWKRLVNGQTPPRVTLFTLQNPIKSHPQHSTFSEMKLKNLMGKFAVWVNEQIMVGRSPTSIKEIQEHHGQ